MPALLAFHPGERSAGTGEIANQIGVDDVAPVVVPHLVDRLGAERRAGHQHVEPAKPFVDRREHRVDAGAGCHVGGEAADLPLPRHPCPRIVERIVQRRAIAPEGEHARAIGGEQRQRRAAKARRPARQQDAFAGKTATIDQHDYSQVRMRRPFAGT